MSTPPLTPTFADIPYAHLSPAQTLDLYLPAGSVPFRLIVNVHGGAFMMGDKRDPHKQPAIAQVVAHGYALASVNYRLSGEALFPAQMQDVKTAVRWLRAHAADYHLNPQAFGAWGDSAGGHLVALLGASGGVASLEGQELGYAQVDSRVQAVVDWFGPIDFLQMDRQFNGTGCPQDHDAPDSPESRLIGAPIQQQPERAHAASPLTYVTPDAPPFFIQHGTADCLIPPQQSQQLYDALCAAIGADKVTLTYLEGAAHGGEAFINPQNMQLVLNFFDRALRS